jgi:hypothetical protein
MLGPFVYIGLKYFDNHAPINPPIFLILIIILAYKRSIRIVAIRGDENNRSFADCEMNLWTDVYYPSYIGSDDGIVTKVCKAIGFLFLYIFIIWLFIRFLLDFIFSWFGDEYKHYIYNSVLKIFSNKALLPANFFITFVSISAICVITYHYLLEIYIRSYEEPIDEDGIELINEVVLEKIFTKSFLVKVFYTFIGIVILSVTVGGQQLIEHEEPASEQKTVETQKPSSNSSIPTDQNQPDFKRYPVLTIYDGAPAKVILATPEERNFRTRLRETQTMPVNFAGEYVFTSWGCGSGCSHGAAVSHRTGKVVFFPYPNFVGQANCVGHEHDVDEEGQENLFDFAGNSRLMKVFGTDEIFGGAGGTKLEMRFFEFNGSKFKLLKSVPLQCQS